MPRLSPPCLSGRPGAARLSRRSAGVLAVAGLALLVLSGCAAQTRYREAQALMADSPTDAGLAKLQEALALDPGNSEYRISVRLARQKLLARHLAGAVQALADGQRDIAEQQYRLALAIDATSPPARTGLQALARDAHHAQMLSLASTELANQQLDAARSRVLLVLDENPKNEQARDLLRSLAPKTEAAAPEARLAAAYRKPVSIDFKDASLKQVFDVIALSSGLNILFDKDVKTDQKVSISLKDSSVDAAIYYLLLTNQLEQQVMDANTLLIFPNSAAKLKDYQQTVVRTFVLANANAKAVAELIKTVVKTRDVVIDDKLNMVIMRDSPDAVRLAEKLVALQDVAEPEVMLEVEILEVSRDRLTELGVTWPTSLSLSPLAGSSGGLTLNDLRNLNSKTLGAAIDPLKLKARTVDGDTNLLANPRIRVLNREKAKIVIGNKVPSITTSVIATGIVTESVTYLDVGLKLDVEPTIYVDNDVAIRMTLEVSNIISSQTTAAGTVTYTIGTRSANTTLRLHDGENQVLAGLINDEDRRSGNKVPGLGELPVAGRLFGSQLADGHKTEIVLSITPRLIRNIQRPAGTAAEFFSGTETSLRRRPLAASALSAATVPGALPVPAAAPSRPAQ